MKITAFISDLSKGGAQGVFVSVVNYLYNKGYDLDIVVQNLIDPVYKDKINTKINITNLNVKSTKKIIAPLVKYVNENDVTNALVFSPEIAVTLLWARTLTNKQFSIIARCINTLSYEYGRSSSFFRKYVTHWCIKKFYYKVDHLISQSKTMADDLIANYNFSSEKISIINNALATKFEMELAKSNYQEKENYILYVGRLEKQKGLFMLIDAFSKLNDNSVNLLLAGSGNEKEALLKYAKDNEVFDRVNFLDYTSNIENLYKKAKITVLSSYYEGFPNVLVESIACGTPIVSYDLPSGPNEIVVDDVNGYLAKYLDVDDLSKQIDRALLKDWNQNTIKRTADKYKQSIIFEKYIDVFLKFFKQ